MVNISYSGERDREKEKVGKEYAREETDSSLISVYRRLDC